MHTHAQFYQSYVRVTYAVEFVEFVMMCMCRCVSVSWHGLRGWLIHECKLSMHSAYTYVHH